MRLVIGESAFNKLAFTDVIEIYRAPKLDLTIQDRGLNLATCTYLDMKNDVDSVLGARLSDLLWCLLIVKRQQVINLSKKQHVSL